MRLSKIIPEALDGVSFLSKKAGSFSRTPQSTVQLWTEKGLILPEVAGTTGTGKRRLYSPMNVIEIGIIRNLSERRVSSKIITEVMNFLHRKEVTTQVTTVDDIADIQDCSADRSNLEKLLDDGIGFVYIFFFGNNEFDIKGQVQTSAETTAGGMLDSGEIAEAEVPSHIYHFIPRLKKNEIENLERIPINMAAYSWKLMGCTSWLVINVSILALYLISAMKK
jgi:DNA-binding transcriptional MerR regulator